MARDKNQHRGAEQPWAAAEVPDEPHPHPAQQLGSPRSFTQPKCGVFVTQSSHKNSSKAMSSPPMVMMLQKLLVEVKLPGQAAWQEIKQLEDNYTKLVSLGRHTGNSLG